MIWKIYVITNSNDDRELVEMFNGLDAMTLRSYVASELKMNFRKIRRFVKLDTKTMKGVCRNLRNLDLL